MTDDEDAELLGLKGWVEQDENKWNIPTECIKCGSKLGKVDAIGLIGIIFVYCKNSKCRWAKIFKERR